jgi:outer membrane protein
MGEDVENQYQLTDLMEFDVPKATYGELREYMFANNQNLKNQFINFELQELNVQGQKSALYPMVSLNLGFTPSVGYIQSFGENEMSISTNSINYSGSVSVRYTLFNGLQRKRNIEIAKIQQQIAGLQIEELQLSMSHQLRSVFELYQTQSQIEDMSLRKVHHAKLLWDLGKDKYDGGLINVFNLNDIRVSYQQARLNYYDRLFDLLKTHYDLLRLTGTIAQEYKAESQLEEE